MIIKDIGEHMAVDTSYHCCLCGHHHCVKCGKCHRCGCINYETTKNSRDGDKVQRQNVVSESKTRNLIRKIVDNIH